jgi:hypothetical protein
MLPMMMRPPTSLRRRRLLGRSQEAACKGGGEDLADFLRAGIVEANASRHEARRADSWLAPIRYQPLIIPAPFGPGMSQVCSAA